MLQRSMAKSSPSSTTSFPSPSPPSSLPPRRSTFAASPASRHSATRTSGKNHASTAVSTACAPQGSPTSTVAIGLASAGKGESGKGRQKRAASPSALSPPLSSSPSSPSKKAKTTNNKNSTLHRSTEEASSSNINNFLNNNLPCKGKRADGESCQRKAKGDCVHGCCVKCCGKICDNAATKSAAAPSSYPASSSPPSLCPAHAKVHQQRKEEEALLSNPINAETSEDRWGGKDESGRVRVEQGHYKEPSIEWLGDTVVIFSLRDFLRETKWSKEALEQGLRRRRGRRTMGQGKELEKEGARMERGRQLRRTCFERKVEELVVKAKISV